MDKLFKENTEIFRWGPIPGRYFYVSEFEDSVLNEYPKIYKGKKWPKTLLIFKDKKMVWSNEFPALRRIGESVFKKFMVPKTKRNDLKLDWRERLKELNSFQNKIDSNSLKELTNEEFKKLTNQLYNKIVAFWSPTVPAELGNYGSIDYLKRKLKKYILDKNELLSAIQILTAPETISFYQQEEIDLLETDDLKKHQKKYFWLKNSYNGIENLSLSFFRKRRNKISKDIRKSIKKYLKEVKNTKKKLILKHKLPKEIIDITNAICEGISWQDERKKHIFIYTYYKELLLKETSRRYNYPLDSLRDCGLKEIYKKTVPQIVKRRKNMYGFFVNGKKEELTGKRALYYWKKYAEESIGSGITKITGTVVSRGKKNIIQGKVKVIFDPKESKGFKKGDILIAPMTSPEYVFLIKLSSAIITDTGGLTSHAAIVSRELKIPCIVGTKIATKALKDGDLVEVDTDKGIVKIIKKVK